MVRSLPAAVARHPARREDRDQMVGELLEEDEEFGTKRGDVGQRVVASSARSVRAKQAGATLRRQSAGGWPALTATGLRARSRSSRAVGAVAARVASGSTDEDTWWRSRSLDR
jgi:hypothetical protein